MAEFQPAPVGGIAAGGVDLLSAVMHELGHVAGIDHDATGAGSDGLMAGRLATGTRLDLADAGDSSADSRIPGGDDYLTGGGVSDVYDGGSGVN